MESRFSGVGAVMKAGVESLTPERVFAGIGFVTIGAFLLDRCYSLSLAARHANTMEVGDFDLLNKRMEHIQSLFDSAKKLRDEDSLGAALEENTKAIRKFHQATDKQEAAELQSKKYAELLYQRAEIYYLLGKYKRAEADLRKALEHDNTLIQACNLLLHLYVDCDELKQSKQAQYSLRYSHELNAEQTFVKYYSAILATEQSEIDFINRLAHQLIAELQNHNGQPKSTIPTVVIPQLMARCMQLNIERAENPEVLQEEIAIVNELLKTAGLVVNQQLRLVLMESIAQARLRMAHLLKADRRISRDDAVMIVRQSCTSNMSKDRVGYLADVQVLPCEIVDRLIKLNHCEQYLQKAEHRDELFTVIQELEGLGKFDELEHAELKQLVQERYERPDELTQAFIHYIKKQGLDVWTVAAISTAEKHVSSLMKIACAEARIDLQVFMHDDAQSLTCMREYQYQSGEIENNQRKKLQVVMIPGQHRLHLLMELNTPAIKEQYLVLKACESVLLLNPENKAFNTLLAQMGFVQTKRKAVSKPIGGSLFSRYAYPLMVLGAGVLATVGAAAFLKKQ